ncbi:phage/plasmid primase, P4 family [Knoellia sp. CPCC 206435]|uniref:phage/plasmid primase, P4 family n=1 Tax=Knoellia terrae TaxID=3404797 RepID=UPI003B43118A
MLLPNHRTVLQQSAISDKVIDARGYASLTWSNTDDQNADRLKAAGFGRALYEDRSRYPGVLIPQFGPTGARLSAQYRPDSPRKDDKGKRRKYESPPNRPLVLDVHPFNTAKIADPTVPLWVTEGVKKGDALTTAGECALSLSGVFAWRRTHGTLGDWEDVQLRGRRVYVCFDSDARTNGNVAAAMSRLGRWLRSRGAKVQYITCLPIDGLDKVGVDDYLANGGVISDLVNAASSSPPNPTAGDTRLTDAVLVERFAFECLADRYLHVHGLGWLGYDGRRWRDVPDEVVVDEVRRYVTLLAHLALQDGEPHERLKQYVALQSAGRIKAIAGLAKGVESVRAELDDFDADPMLLGVGNGVVNLAKGELLEHDPSLLIRRGTDVDFHPGAEHPDWNKALTAFADDDTRDWAQYFLGTAATGLTPREDIIAFWHGGGSNGKTTILGAGHLALGAAAQVLLPTMFGGRREEHPTELMDLLGARFAHVEETGDGHRLDTVKLKRFLGTELITARRMRQDSVTFRATHTLVVSTNHRPVVTDTDHGTWRRLVMVPFPKTFGEDGLPADPGLRGRLFNEVPQQEAVLAWLVEGARRWAADDYKLPQMPEAVEEATKEWRESSDVIYAFVSDRLRSSARGLIEVEHLRAEFNAWLPEPHHPWGIQTFGERFERHEAIKALGASRGKHPANRRAVFEGMVFSTDE